MKSKIMMLALVLVALSIAAPVYGATCANFTITLVAGAGSSSTACQVDGGAVNFSNFSVSGLTGSSTVNVSFLDSNPFGGVSFSPSPSVGGSTSYTASYTANTVGAFAFTTVSDSATPGGVPTYTYTANGVSSGTNVALYNAGVSGTTLTNQGVYTGSIPPSQTMTLNFTIAATGVSTTPEPTSLILFGSGFLAVGLVARARRKVRS